MSSSEKKDFEWEAGQVIDENIVVSVPEVRAQGQKKLGNAVHADPIARKAERDQKIINIQSKPYNPKSKIKENEDLIVEASQSGLSGDFEESVAKKLIDPGKVRGFDRFSNKKTDDKD